MSSETFSFIIPAKNELESLKVLLPDLIKRFPNDEIILVNDGSSDDTKHFAKTLNITYLEHPYSMGNGAAIKTGARQATGSTLIMMDADGQHPPSEVEKLIKTYLSGYDMVVGARDRSAQASFVRLFGNTLYNKIASAIVGHKVPDLTSGFRIINRKKFMEFIHLLPNRFSYPSTITLAFFRTGYSVAYVPFHCPSRIGKSHLNIYKDGLRFFIIIYKITTLFSPLKVFLPLAILHLFLGLMNYGFTFFTQGRFTNMSAVLLTTAIIILLIGLVAEQITMLLYQNNSPSKQREK